MSLNKPHRIIKPPGILCIAIVGKQNNPLLIETKDHVDQPLRFHYLAHMACDFVEERLSSTSTGKSSECYLGRLCMLDRHV
ncbi:hypothetical protein HMI54_009387, partial [Coelomomyces lativittatus]